MCWGCGIAPQGSRVDLDPLRRVKVIVEPVSDLAQTDVWQVLERIWAGQRARSPFTRGDRRRTGGFSARGRRTDARTFTEIGNSLAMSSKQFLLNLLPFFFLCQPTLCNEFSARRRPCHVQAKLHQRKSFRPSIMGWKVAKLTCPLGRQLRRIRKMEGEWFFMIHVRIPEVTSQLILLHPSKLGGQLRTTTPWSRHERASCPA